MGGKLPRAGGKMGGGGGGGGKINCYTGLLSLM